MSEYTPDAKSHRANARDALRGHWVAAAVVSLIGMLFAGNSSEFNLNLNLNNLASTDEMPLTAYAESADILEQFLQEGLGLVAGIAAVIALVILLVRGLLSGVVRLGVCRYNLNLIDRKEARIDDVLSGLPMFWKALLMKLIPTVLLIPVLILWVVSLLAENGILLFASLVLLIVVSVVVSYGFAMAPYVLLEDPICTAWEALKRSYQMMKGHKLELFCLQMSFLGWAILCILTLGLGSFFLNPYTNAANASFYRGLQYQGYAPVEDF